MAVFTEQTQLFSSIANVAKKKKTFNLEDYTHALFFLSSSHIKRVQ